MTRPMHGGSALQWPYQQITPFDSHALSPLLLQAAAVYHDPRYAQLGARLAESSTEDLLVLTLPGASAALRSGL